MKQRTVHLHPKKQYGPDDIDVIEYLKRKGEHLVALQVRSWLNGKCWMNPNIMGDLRTLCTANGDLLNEFQEHA